MCLYVFDLCSFSSAHPLLACKPGPQSLTMKVSHGDQAIRLVCARPDGPFHLMNYTTAGNHQYQLGDGEPLQPQWLTASDKGWMKTNHDRKSIASFFSTVLSDGGSATQDFYIVKNGIKQFLDAKKTNVSTSYPSMKVNEEDFKMVVHALQDGS